MLPPPGSAPCTEHTPAIPGLCCTWHLLQPVQDPCCIWCREPYVQLSSQTDTLLHCATCSAHSSSAGHKPAGAAAGSGMLEKKERKVEGFQGPDPACGLASHSSSNLQDQISFRDIQNIHVKCLNLSYQFARKSGKSCKHCTI